MLPVNSPYPQKALARFWAKVDKGVPSECWEWTAAMTRAGYGAWWTGERNIMAHRASFLIAHGDIPAGMVLDHLCRNRKCVNPAHLEPVSHKENILRGEGATARNSKKSHCPQGHSYDGPVAYVDDDGRRRCGVCRVKPAVLHGKYRTHCIHGHEFDSENTIIRGNGNRACRECSRLRKIAYRQRQREKDIG